ncbi:hypothetical protein, partial [Alloyangia pacifica]|uniref:hypothetical protein n=1 Tax=Alloyangia pacifica TaxID=311180 RepID=UPI001CD747B3
SHQGQRCEPRKQAGHKTASEKVHEIIYDLLCGSHPHRTFAAATGRSPNKGESRHTERTKVEACSASPHGCTEPKVLIAALNLNGW